jgi:hypothetical protein
MGYHTISEGKSVFNQIKLVMNKYRITSNHHLHNGRGLISQDKIQSELFELYKIPSPYVTLNGIRYIRNTDLLVVDLNTITVEYNNITTVYHGITDCSLNLNIGRKIIKNCLVTGNPYRGYLFSFI